MRRWQTTIAVIVVSVLIVVQFFPIDKTNPPVEVDLNASPKVEEVMRRSCYSCPSNETSWPWYSAVVPFSWVVAYDVHEGRAELNYSVWGN
jgi:hypothetical protein